MPYLGSYLWRLRRHLGNDLILIPAAIVALQRPDGRVLLTRRGDDGSWCLPAGAAEVGGSFAAIATAELAVRVGVRVEPSDLVPFATLSEATLQMIRYSSGDVTHSFALCFLARRWQGDPRPDGEEATALRFATLDSLPEPLHPPTGHALELLRAYLDTGVFQLR